MTLKQRFYFSMHALEQMSMRLGITIDLDTRLEILEYAEEITNNEVFEIVGDPAVLSQKNKRNTRYYLLDMSNNNVRKILHYNGYDATKFEGDLLTIFVVREGCCVTFKTNKESEIFSKLKDLRYSSRVNAENRIPSNYII